LSLQDNQEIESVDRRAVSKTAVKSSGESMERETQLELALEATGIFFSVVLQAIYDKLGREEAIRTLMPYMRQLGVAGLRDNTAKLGCAIDLKGVHASFAYFLEAIGGKGEVLECSDDRIVAEVTQCPFSQSPQICEIVEMGGTLGAEELAPQVEIDYEGIMAKGSSKCRILFLRRKP
jgi:hypothetical protein